MDYSMILLSTFSLATCASYAMYLCQLSETTEEIKIHSVNWPSTTSHSSSATSSPLVRMLNQLNSSRLIRPLPSKSHTSKMSDNASLRNKKSSLLHMSKKNFNEIVVGGHKEQSAWSLVRRGLLANVSISVSVTTECLSGGKWLLYTTALWPWPSQSDIPFSLLKNEPVLACP